MRKTNTDYAKRMARILGTTITRCEEMLHAGNEAGLSTSYMAASVEVYAHPKKRRQVRALLAKLGEGDK